MDIKKLATKNLSQGLYADYKPFTSVDGEGFRCAIYVSGCLFNCKGCYNKSIQNFGVGKPYTKEVEDKIIADLSHEGIQGLTLLGGEPFLNTNITLPLVKRVRETFGDTKDIWCWTGYTWEELQESISCDTVNSYRQAEMLSLIDVLVDGRYIEEQEGWSSGKIKFRGSWNQRIISVQESLCQDNLILLDEYMR